jgi:hypothetical protein
MTYGDQELNLVKHVKPIVTTRFLLENLRKVLESQ